MPPTAGERQTSPQKRSHSAALQASPGGSTRWWWPRKRPKVTAPSKPGPDRAEIANKETHLPSNSRPKSNLRHVPDQLPTRDSPSPRAAEKVVIAGHEHEETKQAPPLKPMLGKRPSPDVPQSSTASPLAKQNLYSTSRHDEDRTIVRALVALHDMPEEDPEGWVAAPQPAASVTERQQNLQLMHKATEQLRSLSMPQRPRARDVQSFRAYASRRRHTMREQSSDSDTTSESDHDEPLPSRPTITRKRRRNSKGALTLRDESTTPGGDEVTSSKVLSQAARKATAGRVHRDAAGAGRQRRLRGLWKGWRTMLPWRPD